MTGNIDQCHIQYLYTHKPEEMNIVFRPSREHFAFGITGLLLIAVLFLSTTINITSHPYLSAAFAIDAVVTVPLVYLAMIWKTKVPKFTIAPVSITSLVLGYTFLPVASHSYLNLFENYALPLLELGVLTFITWKARSFVLAMRRQGHSVDFFEGINKASRDLLPKKIAPFFAVEISVIYYAFFQRRKRSLQPNEFTIHKNSCSLALLGVVVFLILVETSVLHILLERWNSTVAWILTILSIYTGLQMLGIARSLPARPIKVEADGIIIRYGIAGNTFIPFRAIASIEATGRDLDKETLKTGLLAQLEPHNIVIKTNETLTFQRLYGIKKSFNSIAFYVDDKGSFTKAVEPHIPTN